MSAGNASNSGTEWHAARSEALAVLHDALGWNLPGPRWEQVQSTVADIAAAVAAASLDALWQTISRLELCSPLRVVTRVGDTPPLPAPKAVRERIAELIDTLAREGDPKVGHEPDRESSSSLRKPATPPGPRR